MSSLDVTAVGAAGGADGRGYIYSVGGPGASVEDTAVPVSANQALSVVVGGVGGNGVSSSSDCHGGAGGSPGGGGAGGDYLTAPADCIYGGGDGGGGGGGYSGLLDPSTTAATPLVIAAGGGGGSYGGGGGYGDIGSGGGPGHGGDPVQIQSFPGGGASGSTGGYGGPPNGSHGTSLAGGDGGSGEGNLLQGSGGGGGGGYAGGGGGAGGGPMSGGGGGGSSYGVGPGLSNEQTATGAASVTITYTQPYTIGAFGQPINDPMNTMSVFKAGSTVSVRFQLTDQNGNPLDDTDASAIAANCHATIGVQYLSPVTGPIDETINSTTANSGNCFRYDTTSHQFIFNLGTKAQGLGTGTYTITANVTGTYAATHSVNVGLR